MTARGSTERGLERGSGTVLALGVIAALLTLLTASLAVGAAISASGRARTAADLAALAGAGVLLSAGGQGEACLVVAEVAGRNGARLEQCTARAATGPGSLPPLLVQVAVDLPVPGIGAARARAQAGAVAGTDRGTGGGAP